MVADLERYGKRHAVITGVVEGGDPGVQKEIDEWCRAAQTRRRFRDTNIAQIGRPYPGMMDLYIDESNLYRRMHLYTKQFDWEKMWAIADDITDEEAIRAKAQDILKTISGTGQLAEMYSIDFNDDIAIIGHSGSGDADISCKKPTMKIVKVFHGKTGGGYLTQFYPYTGPVTYLAITQDGSGNFKFVAAEILSFGDTNMRTRFF